MADPFEDLREAPHPPCKNPLSATGRRAMLKKYNVLPRTYWPGNERKRSAVPFYEPKRFSSLETFMCRNTSPLECEVCCGVNFVLPIQYFQYTRGVVNNFSTTCEFWSLQRLKLDL